MSGVDDIHDNAIILCLLFSIGFISVLYESVPDILQTDKLQGLWHLVRRACGPNSELLTGVVLKY